MQRRNRNSSRKKHTSPPWSDVKSGVVGLDKKQLVELIRDRYRLSTQNQSFPAACSSLGDDPLAPYKKTINECMYPDVMKDKPVQIAKARTAI
jgi:hypothetical protein